MQKLFGMVVDALTFYPYPENIQERLDALKEKNAKATKKFISSQRGASLFFSFYVCVIFAYCLKNAYLIPSIDSPEQPPAKKQNVEKNKDTNASWEQIDDERLGLQNQQPGVIAWAKIPGHCWWPGISAFVLLSSFFY